MSEYIVSQEQFETIARAVLKNIDRPITEVVVGADKLPEIVRCQDCKYYDEEPDLESSMPKCWRDPDHRGTAIWTPPDGFCWLGERNAVDE